MSFETQFDSPFFGKLAGPAVTDRHFCTLSAHRSANLVSFHWVLRGKTDDVSGFVATDRPSVGVTHSRLG